jgi:purine-binding chemotaxis protein CheW
LGARSSQDVKAAQDPSPPAAPSPPTPSETAQWVVFGLDQGRYALPLTAVERIVRAAYVTPLPLAPSVVLGAIDVEGRILPVFSVRRRFGLPQRAIDPADQFLIARTAQGTVVLAIDAAQGVLERPAASLIDAATIAPNLPHIRGVIALEDGLVLIHDLEQFLSADEAHALNEAMNQAALHAG